VSRRLFKKNLPIKNFDSDFTYNENYQNYMKIIQYSNILNMYNLRVLHFGRWLYIKYGLFNFTIYLWFKLY